MTIGRRRRPDQTPATVVERTRARTRKIFSVGRDKKNI